MGRKNTCLVIVFVGLITASLVQSRVQWNRCRAANAPVVYGVSLPKPTAAKVPCGEHESPTDHLTWSLPRSGEPSHKRQSVKGLNVLFIAIDDLRPELGCYGADHIKSPNIDRLASQGVQFNRAYCQAPHCGPSRASLLTGVHTRHHDLVMSPEEIAPNAVTLPGAFRQAGYTTVGNGKIFHHNLQAAQQSWCEPPFSLVNGPKENNHLTFHDKESANFILAKNKRGPFYEAPDVPDDTYIDGQTCDKAIKDMQRLATMDKPFFLACGFVRPHLPFYAPKKYWDLYDRDTIKIAPNRFKPKNAPKSLRGSGEFGSYHDRDIPYNSPAFHKTARHGYYACVSYADALVGRLLAELDRLSLTDNTIVVLWGDHGWHLGEHNFWSKHNLLHNSTHAPLIMRVPGFKKGVKTDGIVEFIDIYPTLCDLVGIEQPGHLEGRSLVPLLRDPKQPGKAAAFTKWRNGLAVTTRDYTYTEYGQVERMLFDRRHDPGENVNVADAAEYQETVRQLSRLLAQASDSHQATVVINTEAKTRQYDRMIFGGFLEHFGRQVYGGVFEPGSPLADDKGYRLDVIEALSELKLPVIRWPGGCFVDAYHWHKGVGKDREPYGDPRWGVIESNQFGTHEFVEFCTRIGAEPYICFNGLAPVQENLDWVAYCNATEGTCADMRKNNGHAQPFNVKFWSAGNERYDKAYIHRVRDTAKAMKALFANVQITCSGSQGGQGTSMRGIHEYLMEQACLRHCENVTMENIAPIVNTRGPLFVHPNGLVKRTHFHTMAVYASLLKEHVGDVKVEAGKLIHGKESVCVIDAIATVDKSKKNWSVALVNRHPLENVKCTIKLGHWSLDGTYRATLLTGASPDAYNDIEHPNRVVPKEVELTFRKGVVELPPHSLTIVRVRG